MKALRYVLFGIVVLGLIVGVLKYFDKQQQTNTSPPQIIHNFVNLDNVQKISKYRSCQGHVVVPTDERESKRNMKHYFWIRPEVENVELYAPFDGIVTGIMSFPNEGLEGEIWISIKGGEWSFSLQHINILDNLTQGSVVEAGELLGYVAKESFDVVYAIGATEQKVIDGWNSPYSDLDTVFNHMHDEVFTEYQAKGILQKSDLIHTKSYRDNNKCVYLDQQGNFGNGDLQEDWVELTVK